MLFGLAVKDTVGAVTLTETVAEFEAVPPGPVQASANFVVAPNATVAWLPLVDSLPAQPPVAEQDVAFVADHVNVDVLPLLTVVGLAEIVTTGAGVVTETVVD